MKNSYIIPAVLIFCVSLLSCKKFVTIAPPQNQIIGASVFQDDQTAISALVDIYLNMVGGGNNFVSINMTRLGGLYADEMSYTKTSEDFQQFMSGSLLTDNSFVGTTWSGTYGFIYQANACIEGITGSNVLTDSVKRQLLGEATFVRALCYFYLYNLYGDVPLVTTTDYKANARLGRTALATVTAQVITDLTEAIRLLGSVQSDYQNERPTQWAAKALLARTYLYAGDWTHAALYSDSVIRSGNFQLTTSPNDVFLKNSPEAIWQLNTDEASFDTWEGYQFVPYATTIIPYYSLTDSLLKAFEPGDLRKADWIQSNTVSGKTYAYPYKYKSNGKNGTEYMMALRLAEQYLIRAEAEAELQQLDAATADINVIRQRAGLSPLPVFSDQAACLQAIWQERRVELFCEWGHRLLDLKRTGRADAVLGVKTSWKATSVLWPVPLTELQTNPSLVQNPGY